MTKPRTGKFEWWKALSGYYWCLKSPNGKIIAQSEGYDTKRGCLNGIKAVASVAGTATMVNLNA